MKQTERKRQGKQYSTQFKEQALERAGSDGVPKRLRVLGWMRVYGIHGVPSAATALSFEEHKRQQAERACLKREKARVEGEAAFLKEGGSVLRETAGARYAMTQAHEDINPATKMMK